MPAQVDKLTGLASRFGAFVAEHHPFALDDAVDAFLDAAGDRGIADEAAIDALRPRLTRELGRRLDARQVPEGLAESTPRIAALDRIVRARVEVRQACDGFLRRAALDAGGGWCRPGRGLCGVGRSKRRSRARSGSRSCAG